MYTIRKQFKFEMAHQLYNAYSTACSKQIHGHSYICEVFFTSSKLDETEMVIDFGKIKALINEYINSWDHCLVMPNTMPKEYLECLALYNENLKIVNYNPTAERMAKDMYEYISVILTNEGLLHSWSNNDGIKLKAVRLHETTTGWAEYEM